MYPDFLMREKIKDYWYEEEFFWKHPFHMAESILSPEEVAAIISNREKYL